MRSTRQCIDCGCSDNLKLFFYSLLINLLDVAKSYQFLDKTGFANKLLSMILFWSNELRDLNVGPGLSFLNQINDTIILDPSYSFLNNIFATLTAKLY